MSIILTKTQNIREKSNLDKDTLRASNYGALDLFVSQNSSPTGLITPALIEKAKASIGSTLQTPVFNYREKVTIGNARTVTIADDENTTAMYTFNFVTCTYGFTQVPVAFQNNEISAQADFDRKFMQFMVSLGDTLDTAAIASLSAAKSQVLGDNLDYPFTANVIQSTWAKRENLIGDLNPMMKSNDYYGKIHVLGNGGVESLVNKMAQKSVYNEVNKTLEYNDKILHFSNRVTNESGKYGTGYAVEEGSLGFLTRFEREAVAGTQTPTHQWDIINLPLLGIPCGTYYYYGVDDYHTIAGAATADCDRVVKEHYGFAVDVCFVTPYNNAVSTNASPILKFNIGSEVAS